MKNYYHVLGLEPNCTKENIRKAYKEYARNFHPDRHSGSEFFSRRFIEIKEAYDILNDSIKKEEHDLYHGFNQKDRKDEPKSNDRLPEIIEFKTNSYSLSFTPGIPITFHWEVVNADNVELSPFGYVTAKGSKTVKIKNNIQSLKVTLIALNTKSGVKEIKVIPLQNAIKTSDLLPKIIEFRENSSNLSFTTGEPITFHWEVVNADKVQISLFGYVTAKGSRTIKIKNDVKSLEVKLTALNTKLNIKETKIISLQNRVKVHDVIPPIITEQSSTPSKAVGITNIIITIVLTYIIKTLIINEPLTQETSSYLNIPSLEYSAFLTAYLFATFASFLIFGIYKLVFQPTRSVWKGLNSNIISKIFTLTAIIFWVLGVLTGVVFKIKELFGL